MKLGLQLGYWGAQPPQGVGELVAAAEESGFDAIFTAEAWGSDAFTPLAWWGRETSRIKLGTSIVQMSGRTPTSIAMHALTLDHLSERPGHPGHGRERPAGRRGLVRPAVRQAAGPHPRGRRHHPQGARPRGQGHQRRPALPAAVQRRGLRRASASRSSRSCTRCAPTCRSGSAPRARRTSRRPPRSPTAGSRSSTRRSRPAMYQPVARRGLRATRRPPYARATSRSPRPATSRWSPNAEEKQFVLDAIKPSVVALHGRHGRQGGRTSTTQVFVRMGYEDLADRGAAALPQRREGRGDRADPRRARRRHAHRRHAGEVKERVAAVGGDRRDHPAAAAPGPPTRSGRWPSCSRDRVAPVTRYGFIGVGSIAAAMVVGLCDGRRRRPAGRALAAQRGAGRPSWPSASDVRVAADNQAVVDAADVVVVCLLPGNAAEVLSRAAVPARPGCRQRGRRRRRSRGCARSSRPRREVARSVPLPAVATRESVTPVHPAGRPSRSSSRGSAAAWSSTTSWRTSRSRPRRRRWRRTSATSAPIAGWLDDRGIPAADARRYVAATFAALAGELGAPEPDFAALGERARDAAAGSTSSSRATSARPGCPTTCATASIAIADRGLPRTETRSSLGAHDGRHARRRPTTAT